MVYCNSANQTVFRVGKVTREMNVDYGNQYGYLIVDTAPTLMKVITTAISEEEVL